MLGPVICLSPCEGLVAINPKLTPCAGEPTQRTRRATSRFLFDLAPDGACHAVFLAENPVVSYTTFSPLSRPRRKAHVGTVYFLWRFPFPLIWQRASPDDTGDILPCGVRTFLSRKIRCGISPERPNPRSIDIQRTGGNIRDQGCQYNIRLQKLHCVMARPFLASCTRCGGSFIWQPPQAA